MSPAHLTCAGAQHGGCSPELQRSGVMKVRPCLEGRISPATPPSERTSARDGIRQHRCEAFLPWAAAGMLETPATTCTSTSRSAGATAYAQGPAHTCEAALPRTHEKYTAGEEIKPAKDAEPTLETLATGQRRRFGISTWWLLALAAAHATWSAAAASGFHNLVAEPDGGETQTCSMQQNTRTQL